MAGPKILSEVEVEEGLRKLPGWELRDGRLRKQFQFRTFLRAVAFVNSVAYLAESAGHHPDMTINYNRVTLRLITHSEKGADGPGHVFGGGDRGEAGDEVGHPARCGRRPLVGCASHGGWGRTTERNVP